MTQPLKRTILIKNAVIYTLNAKDEVVRGNILVQGNRIAYVGEELPQIQAEREIDAEGNLVFPGFSNGHTHLPMTLLRGAGEDLPLMDWLTQKIFPLEDKLSDELAYLGSMLGIIEMVKTGTTSLADMYFFCDGIAAAIQQSGIRANLSRCVSGQTMEEAQGRIDDALRIYDTYHGAAEGRLEVGFSVHGEYTTGTEVIRKVCALARERDAVLQIHISETENEHEECKKRHGGKTPLGVLESLGGLEGRVIAAHGVYIDDEDMERIAGRDVTIVTCPKSNLKLGSGIARVQEMLSRGVRVALGTDGAASNNTLDLMDEMRYMALLQKGMTRDPGVMDIRQCLRIAMQNGARGMGIEAGEIAPGMLADLILVNTKSSRFYPRQNAEAHVLYSACSQDISMTMIDGRVVYENGKIQFCDEARVLTDFARAAEKLYR